MSTGQNSTPTEIPTQSSKPATATATTDNDSGKSTPSSATIANTGTAAGSTTTPPNASNHNNYSNHNNHNQSHSHGHNNHNGYNNHNNYRKGPRNNNQNYSYQSRPYSNQPQLIYQPNTPYYYPYNAGPQLYPAPVALYSPQQLDVPNSIPQKPFTSPIKKSIGLSIKNKDGQPVNFTRGHNKTASFSSNSSISSPLIPKANLNTPITSTISATTSTSSTDINNTIDDATASTPSPVVASVTPIPAKSDDKKSANELFKAAFLAKLQAKKKEEPKKAEDRSPSTTTDIIKEVKTEIVQEATSPDIDVSPKKEIITASTDSTNNELKSAQLSVETNKESESNLKIEDLQSVEVETKANYENSEVEVQSKPEDEVVIIAEAEKEDEPKAEVELEIQEEIHGENLEEEEQKENDEEEKEEEKEEEEEEEEEEKEPEIKEMTMTQFFERLAAAKPVENVYEFTYPEDTQLPDKKFEGRVKKFYDPLFLFQFEDKCKFQLDDEWKAKFSSKIYIPENTKREGRDRSNRGYSHREGLGGRVSGGGSGSMRGGSMRGADYNSRTGSRSGSKRKTGRDSGRDKSRRDRGDREGSRRPRNERGDKKDYEENKSTIPPEEVAPLVPSANRWVPKSQKKVVKEVKYAPDGVTVLLDDGDIQSKVKSLLNKLTLEKFDTITDEMLAIANQSKWETKAETLKRVIELTFQKATDEPHWSSMYAKWCHKLCSAIDPEISDEETFSIDPNTNEKVLGKGSNLVFRLLVSRCQSEYEKGWSNKLPTNEDGSPLEAEMMSDEYYKIAAAKRRGLGLVRFIGELYSLNLIRSKVIVACLVKIIQQDDESELPEEDTLETLMQLVMSVGKLMDQNEGKKFMDFTFAQIKKYIDHPDISPRLRFKLMDLVDLRRHRWSSGKEGSSGPKTISQIHAEAEKKKRAEDAEKDSKRGGSRRGDRNDRSNNSRSNSKWGSNSDQLSSKDLSKVGMVRNSSEKSLGPFSRSKKQSGSNTASGNSLSSMRNGSNINNHFTTVGNGRSSSIRSAAPVPPATNTEEKGEERQVSVNMFSALMDNEEEEEEEEEYDGEEKAEVDEEEEAHVDAEIEESSKTAEEEKKDEDASATVHTVLKDEE